MARATAFTTFVLAAALLASAGCSGPAPPDDEAPSSQEPVLPPGVERTSIAGSDGGNGTASPVLALNATGEAGEWLVVHAPFTHGIEQGGYDLQHEFVVDGEAGTGAFFVPLAFTYAAEGGGWMAGRVGPFLETLLTFDAEQTWTLEQSVSFGTGTAYTGILLAAAGERPWTLTARIGLDGTTFGNATVLRGTGATFVHGGDATAPVPGAPLANQLSFRAPSPGPGWSHLEMLRERVQPDGASSIQMTLANGDSRDDMGTQNGHDGPTGGSAGGGHLDYFGSPMDTAGEVTGQAIFARADLATSFGYVHLPFDAALLPGMQPGGYDGSLWPFQFELGPP